MKVAALTSGRDDPSARFRIRQHIAPLAVEGVEVKEYIPLIDKHAGIPSVIADRTPEFMLPFTQQLWRVGKLAARAPGIVGAYSADLIWLNRELLPGHYSLERLLRKPFVLDVDDAVWRARPDGPGTMKKLGKTAVAVFAGNRAIAEWFSPYSKNIHIVPTAIDTDRFRPLENQFPPERPFTVGWTGTSGNFGYLYAIEKPLQEFLSHFNARLLIVAEMAPRFALIGPDKVEFKRWSPDVESSALTSMDVGLMPLPDNEWTRGKCAFKMLQYMSCGLPVVVSPVGMNSEVLAQGRIGFGATSENDWFSSLAWLHDNRNDAHAMGTKGRHLIQEHYSQAMISQRIATIFTQLCAR